KRSSSGVLFPRVFSCMSSRRSMFCFASSGFLSPSPCPMLMNAAEEIERKNVVRSILGKVIQVLDLPLYPEIDKPWNKCELPVEFFGTSQLRSAADKLIRFADTPGHRRFGRIFGKLRKKSKPRKEKKTFQRMRNRELTNGFSDSGRNSLL